jgi:hypothetical protein
MTTTMGKLMLLELVSGIFGWVWIIAGIAALVFLIWAIGFAGPWSRFFWAVGISVVAKWLAKAFMDTQIRVGFEAEKIAEGMSPAEARQEWIKRYMNQR